MMVIVIIRRFVRADREQEFLSAYRARSASPRFDSEKDRLAHIR
jgi:hypothetical protein